MLLYEEYKLSHRRSAEHYNKTFWLAWMPAGVAALMIYAKGSSAGAGLWGGLGFAMAVQMILWSGRAIHRPRQRLSPFSRKLVETSDTWFPQFLITIQGAVTGITILLLWFTLCELGVRSMFVQHLALVLAVILIPLRRIASIRIKQAPGPKNEIRYEIIHYSQIIFVTLFIAFCFHLIIMPEGENLTSDVPLGAILLWIPACLIIVSCIVLFVDHLIRKQAGLTRQPQPTKTSEPADTF